MCGSDQRAESWIDGLPMAYFEPRDEPAVVGAVPRSGESDIGSSMRFKWAPR
jgi:hypothetical protein